MFQLWAQGLEGLSQAHFAFKQAKKGPLLWICESDEVYGQVLRDFRFWRGCLKQPFKLFLLPPYEQSPYQALSENPLLTMERLGHLHALALSEPFDILLTSPGALLRKTLSFDTFQKRTHMVSKGSPVDREALLQDLRGFGYTKVTTVEDPGTYAVRGSVIDIYWPKESHPVRLDLFGNTLDRLYTFSAETQGKIQDLEEFILGPVKEVALDEVSVHCAVERLSNLADELNYPTKKLKDKLDNLAQGIPFFGMEQMLPAFEKLALSPLEILKRCYPNLQVIFTHPAEVFRSTEALHKRLHEQYDHLLSKSELCFLPKEYYLNKEEFLGLISQFNQIRIAGFLDQPDKIEYDLKSENLSWLREDILKEHQKSKDLEEEAHHLLLPLVSYIKKQKAKNQLVLLPVMARSGLGRLAELLAYHQLQVEILSRPPDLEDLPVLERLRLNARIHAYAFVAEPILPYQGAFIPDLQTVVITEEEIFGRRTLRQAQSKAKGFKTTLSELEPGDFVVHMDHGIGEFRGLAKLNLRGADQDYILITYAGDDKLYLPVHRINSIQRYAYSQGNRPRLDKLGGTGWQSKKTKVKQAVIAMAQDLLQLYAKREMVKRPVFSPPAEAYFEFESQFPFETTPDQQKAIDDVLLDLQKEKPMDRLVCGDVGYGKTEVAMRAAMMAVLSHRQVAILAPTTVLAQQHFLTFSKRFAESGAQVAVISRFQKPKEIELTLKKLKEGKIDIIIGTHRLLSSDVHFSQLGLLIVDEEQRFGIKAKEHIKKLRNHVDILTLSATPIPRTLQMGMFAIRDLSIIETPPVDRRAIRTQISPADGEVIAEAIKLEISRGGQVYFVHNRVSSIYARADEIRQLVPGAKVVVGHGQMDEAELEKVMLSFMNHEFHVLVCTTIIETGIDVPSANTILIDDADDFGLAQLYQLRGRVGRSHERAFAYLLISGSTEHLTPIAKKRLEVLHRFSELGAGFRIAQHDLELRGAGDFLGDAQHGHMASVGYDLYADLLKEAVEELKGKGHSHAPDPEVQVPVSALIPEKYILDLQDRLSFYQRLALADTIDEIWDAVGIMEDQYGEAPEEVRNLAEVMSLKSQLRGLWLFGLEIIGGVSAIEPPKVVISLGESARLNPEKLVAFVNQNPKIITLTPKMKLIWTTSPEDWVFQYSKDMFKLALSKISCLEHLV